MSDRIVLGSGEVYIDEFSGSIPQDNAIETAAKRLGYIKGGATLSYKPTTYKAIDDLGRVVIPKEIRRTMRIREGDPLEIFTEKDGEVIFKKYYAVSEMSENAGYVADIMHKIAGCPVIIVDKDPVVASTGVPRKEFAERRVTGQNRGQFFCPDGSTNNFFPVEGVERTAIAALPIITAGDVSGAVAFLTSEKCTEVTDLQKSLINAAAQFLARQIEG